MIAACSVPAVIDYQEEFFCTCDIHIDSDLWIGLCDLGTCVSGVSCFGLLGEFGLLFGCKRPVALSQKQFEMVLEVACNAFSDIVG